MRTLQYHRYLNNTTSLNLLGKYQNFSVSELIVLIKLASYLCRYLGPLKNRTASRQMLDCLVVL
jgi:hypothetical protein